MSHKSFIAELSQRGLLSPDSRAAAEAASAAGARARPGSLGKRLLGDTRLRPADFADLVADHRSLPRATLEAMRAGTTLADAFSTTFLHEAGLYPYRGTDGSVRLAMADPFDDMSIDAVVLTLGGEVRLEVASFDDVEAVLDALRRGADAQSSAPEEAAAAAPDDSDALRDLASGAPVVRALDDIFDQAVAFRASDIHVEPRGQELHIRLRVDGVLRPIPAPRSVPARAIVSRIKILSGLNIAERRQPQDGRIRTTVRGRQFDVRVATMPTIAGEAAILRLLDRTGQLVGFGDLGLGARDRRVLELKLAQPHGMIIATGPTGSGKTTTLTAALASLNDSTRKILTIEDPVEYEIPGINQSQVRPAAGLTFASALRAFMRQDPDVIMVGEVRDAETARIAIQASLTGHLVMTTLHTNTAAAAITRLVDIGVERYLIASTLSAVIGQRLVRRLCPDCRRPIEVDADLAARDPRVVALAIPPGTVLHMPQGCDRCSGTGYRGRCAIFECLEITEAVRHQILGGAGDAALERAAVLEGMTTLVDHGRARCLEGMTSLDEVFRVAALR